MPEDETNCTEIIDALENATAEDFAFIMREVKGTAREHGVIISGNL